MDQILNYIRETIPANLVTGITLGVVAVVFMTEATKQALTILEDYLEKKKGHEIVFFDHTKIILSILWSLSVDAALVIAGLFPANQFLLFVFVLIGASNVLYELILKKIKSKIGNENN